jgi:diazepam-binding inhibitor (GABA receptor modulating acyl-CoA-binding protein)
MDNLKELFDQAAAESKNLPERPDNLTLLKLYSLYKQAMEGDVHGNLPDANDFVGRAKWEAWSALKGTHVEQAQQDYIDLVKSLKSPD